MIRAIIFDMDGILIDSEPLWQEAEISAFKTVGVELTRVMCYETVGFRLDEVVDHWYRRFPWTGTSQKEIERLIIDNVVALVAKDGTAKPGVHSILHFLKTKPVKIGLASGSYYQIINAILQKLNIHEHFDLVYSAEDEPYGKPHPGIYINAAKKLGVRVDECLVFEDSFNGVLAAKAAKMKCIAVPDLSAPTLQKLMIADKQIASLEEFDEEMWNEANG
ncbi:MAG: hexitol phosphatase HxpB [Candidatus Peribacteraceae bacterium]|nr:hexitol phosphatase HxpB [Candidatus Peribacteraceae bacterium]